MRLRTPGSRYRDRPAQKVTAITKSAISPTRGLRGDQDRHRRCEHHQVSASHDSARSQCVPTRASSGRAPPHVGSGSWVAGPGGLVKGNERPQHLQQRKFPEPFGTHTSARALPRFNTTTRQSAPLRRISTFGLAVGAACALSLGIAGQVLTFRTRARLSFAPPPCRMPLGQSQCIPQADPGGMATPRF